MVIYLWSHQKPWDYDKLSYKQCNQVERLFRRIKRFRRIFTRYDKLGVIFLAFIYFAFTIDEELPEATMEAVKAGEIICDQNKYRQIVTAPGCQQKELLEYAQREDIGNGPIFRRKMTGPCTGCMCLR